MSMVNENERDDNEAQFATFPNSDPFTRSSSTSASSNNLLSGRFDVLEWHPAYLSCQKYFLDHSQHDPGTQALAALMNITLPFQRTSDPIVSSSQTSRNTTTAAPYDPYTASSAFQTSFSHYQGSPATVSLIPYIRRLVVTGFDKDAILHGFFGDDWRKGIGPLQECERRNYLFAAKSGGWSKVKAEYNMNPQETVPFLQPLQNVQLAEIENAEKVWSQWLAMEDWMIGPRAPEAMNDYGRPNISRPQN